LSGGVNLNPVLIYDEVRKDVAVTPEEFVEFLGAIFPLWWNHRARYPDVEPFKSLVTNIIDGGNRLACVDSGSCTYQHINIAPNGDTSQCGRSADWGLLQYGNIRDRSFDDILHDPQREQLRERLAVIANGDCAGCRMWELCHGGCPLDAWSKHGDFAHKSEWCEARRGSSRSTSMVTGRKFEPKEHSAVLAAWPPAPLVMSPHSRHHRMQPELPLLWPRCAAGRCVNALDTGSEC
jgi:radical SAM protein with 4Fe4S-binding SPASM domain